MTMREDYEPQTAREKMVARFAFLAGWVAKGSGAEGLASDHARLRYPIPELEVPVTRRREVTE
jgi:hypothetical protein